MRRWAPLLVFLTGTAFVALTLVASISEATTLTASDGNDSGVGSLRQAIAGAGNGDVIQFSYALPGATITISSPLPTINASVTFDVKGNPATIVGVGVSPFFIIGSSGEIALDSGAGLAAASAGVQADGIVDISGVTVGQSLIRTLSGSGIVTLGDGTLNIQSASTEFSGVISYGGLDFGLLGGVEISSGTQTLSGHNTYMGPTQIDLGATLALKGAGSIADSLYLAIEAGGVLDISQTTSGATVAGMFATDSSALVKLGSQTLSISGNAGPFAGNIQDGGIGGGVGGGVTILGGGVLALEGQNFYTGLTTIQAGGELDLASSGGQTGAIAASRGVVDDGVFDISGVLRASAISTLSGGGQVNLGSANLTLIKASGTFSGVIADDGKFGGTGGSVTIAGGKEIFSGANTYTGGTIVIGGATIGVGANFALGAGVLTLNDGSTLSFEADGLNLANHILMPGRLDPIIDTGANNATISGVISGPGALTKAGTGLLNLTANNAYTGATIVSAGTLVVDGSIASSASLTLNSGATLGGSGTVPGFVVPSGASVAPGAAAPFRTLQVAGAIGFLAGSTYVVNVNAAGASDRIVAAGAAAISGGTVHMLAANGVYSASTRYTILTATGGLSGGFASLTTTSNLAFLTPALSYDADNAYLGFTAKTTPSATPGAPPTLVTFPSVALTPNQKASAGATQLLGPGERVYDVVLGQTIAGARAAFDALSGEIHPSAISGAFEDSRLPREAVLDRLASPYGALVGGGANGFAATKAIAAPTPSQTLAAWGQAFGSWGHVGGDGNAAALDRSLGGFILGADATLDQTYRIGVAGGYTQSTLSVDARGSSGRVDTTYAGLYGGASYSALQLRGGALYAYNRYATDRSVSFPGFADSVSSGYRGDTLQAFGEAGWRVAVAGFGGATSIEPFVGAMAMHIHSDSFKETGGAAALIGASSGYDLGTATLGLRAETSPFADAPLTARGMLGWRHAFGDMTPTSTLAFASAPGVPFSIAGAPIARDALLIEAGLDWRISKTATFGLFYSGELGSRDEDNAVKGKLEIAF